MKHFSSELAIDSLTLLDAQTNLYTVDFFSVLTIGSAGFPKVVCEL